MKFGRSLKGPDACLLIPRTHAGHSATPRGRGRTVLSKSLICWWLADAHGTRSRRRADALCGVLALSLLASAPPASPETVSDASSTAFPTSPLWGFSLNLGVGRVGGAFGTAFQRPLTGEVSIDREVGAWRVGAGLSFGSLALAAPYDDEPEVTLQRASLFGTRVFGRDGRARPYLQLRAGLARAHPRSLLFAREPLPGGLRPGESATPATNGFHGGLVPGVEFQLRRSLALDVSVALDVLALRRLDLAPLGRPPVRAGSTWETRVGLRWSPEARAGGRTHADRTFDAWGVRRDWGGATGQLVGGNLAATAITEYLRNQLASQISPRSWRRNLAEGFTYDDNDFRTNQFLHPVSGGAYYNAGRANGFGFWASSMFALLGTLGWECCGETHPASYNDLISTSLGGIALGEVQYRLASEILDGQRGGADRSWREAVAFAVDPVRGFNRAVSRRALRRAPNPHDPLEWRPPHTRTRVTAGWRTLDVGEALERGARSHPFVTFEHLYGDPFSTRRRRPYDVFTLNVEASSGDKATLTHVGIRGELLAQPLGEPGSSRHVVALTQHFDYFNNSAFEFGGQALGPSLLSRFALRSNATLTTRVEALGLILGAVNSEYAYLADVPDQGRTREYDYGPGAGFGVEAALNVSGREVLAASYRFTWIAVANGSVFNAGAAGRGSSATHHVRSLGLRAALPLRGGLSVGADTLVFWRDSDYAFAGFADAHQRTPQVRLYFAWNGGR